MEGVVEKRNVGLGAGLLLCSFLLYDKRVELSKLNKGDPLKRRIVCIELRLGG